MSELTRTVYYADFNKLQLLMDEKGLERNETANCAGLRRATLTLWKQNRKNITANELYLLSRYFNVPMEYFISERKVPVDTKNLNPVFVESILNKA